MHASCFGQLIIFSWLLTCMPFVVSEEKSCLNNSSPTPYIHYMDQHTSIIVQTSDRTLHRLSTEIFKIFIEEMIGFGKVDIVTHDEEFDTKEVVNRLSPTELQNNEL